MLDAILKNKNKKNQKERKKKEVAPSVGQLAGGSSKNCSFNMSGTCPKRSKIISKILGSGPNNTYNIRELTNINQYTAFSNIWKIKDKTKTKLQ